MELNHNPVVSTISAALNAQQFAPRDTASPHPPLLSSRGDFLNAMLDLIPTPIPFYGEEAQDPTGALFAHWDNSASAASKSACVIQPRDKPSPRISGVMARSSALVSGSSRLSI